MVNKAPLAESPLSAPPPPKEPGNRFPPSSILDLVTLHANNYCPIPAPVLLY